MGGKNLCETDPSIISSESLLIHVVISILMHVRYMHQNTDPNFDLESLIKILIVHDVRL